MLDPNYKPITGVGERIVSQAMTNDIPVKGTMYDAFGKEINTKLTPSNNPTEPTTKSKTVGQMGGRPNKDSSFNSALFARDALGIANYFRANKEFTYY